MGRASRSGARLLIMPEYAAEQWLSFAGGKLSLAQEIPWLAEQSEAALEALRPLPERYGMALLAGTMPVRIEGGADGSPPYVNRAHLLLPDGRVVTHDKLCLTPPEKNPDGWHLSPGGSVTLVEWAGIRIVSLVCLDIELPAVAGRLAAMQPDILLVPSQTETLAGVNRVFTCARARATELFAAVCVVGCIGAAATGVPRGGYVSGAAAYLPSDASIGHTGVWDEMPPVDGARGPGPVLLARDIPLGRVREFRKFGAEVWPGAFDASDLRFEEA
ncbi:MAG: nitrilase-related carbon-nitrogen hydrolase [Gammaproteobacteria bacterium]|nr:nitrilase-related carbon-nitrogen hydrolase [Gammaproteobacteria bacterium]